MEKAIEVPRESVHAESGRIFHFTDVSGRFWCGTCRFVDYTPGNMYKFGGNITTGPAEWIGLKVEVSGGNEDKMMTMVIMATVTN